MGDKFNIAEILESVDMLLSDNMYSGHIKNNNRSNYKRFTDKNIKTKDDTFKINSIVLAKPNEKKSETHVDDPVTEKIIHDAEESLNNLKNENKISETNNEKVLILKDEFITTDIT